MSDQRTAVKKAISARSTSDRLRKQAESVRKEKRALLAKRLRNAGSLEGESLRLDESALQNIMQDLLATTREANLKGLKTLRQALCIPDFPASALLNQGLMDILIKCLTSSISDVQCEAIWCLTNIATGDHEQTGRVLVAVPILLQYLGGSDYVLKEQACWTIGNIAGDSNEYREILLANGALKPLMDFLLESSQTMKQHTHVAGASSSNSSSSISPKGMDAQTGGNFVNSPRSDPTPAPTPTTGMYTQDAFVESGDSAESDAATMQPSRAQTAAWAISNLARGKVPASLFIDAGYTPFLISLLNHADAAMVVEVCWAFAFLCAKDLGDVSVLVDQGAIGALVQLAQRTRGESLCAVPLVRCLGNLTSGPVQWIDAVLRQPHIVKTLLGYCNPTNSALRAVCKETIWVLGNILGGNDMQTAFVLREGLPALGEMLIRALTGDHFDSQREAVIALQNWMVSGDRGVLAYIVTKEVISQLIALLRVQENDVIMCSLELLRCIVQDSEVNREECMKLGMLEAIDTLQYGPVPPPVQAAASSLAELFEEEEEDVDDAIYGPGSSSGSAAGNANTFGYGDTSGPATYQFGGPANTNSTVFNFQGPGSGIYDKAGTGLAAQENLGCDANNGIGGSVGRGRQMTQPSWMNPQR